MWNVVYYTPNYDKNGNAIDKIYSHGSLIKNHPFGFTCPCSWHTFYNDKNFRKHQKTKNHIENLKLLKKKHF